MVPVVVIVPPVIGLVVAMLVTDPPAAATEQFHAPLTREAMFPVPLPVHGVVAAQSEQ